MSKTTEAPDQVRLEVRIEGPRERVWQALTDEWTAWWPAESFNVGGASARMTFEPRVGGRLYEDWGAGGGLLWGQVVGLRPPELLQTVADLFPEWGGPARSYLTWRLEADGDATVVHLLDAQLGERTPDQRGEKEKGWAFLVACLKAYVQGGPPPAWQG